MKWGGGGQGGRLRKRAPINTQRMNIEPGRHTHQHQQHQLPEYVASSYTNTVYISDAVCCSNIILLHFCSQNERCSLCREPVGKQLS